MKKLINKIIRFLCGGKRHFKVKIKERVKTEDRGE